METNKINTNEPQHDAKLPVSCCFFFLIISKLKNNSKKD